MGKFKAGDTVQILSKSRGCYLKDSPFTEGQIVVVNRIGVDGEIVIRDKGDNTFCFSEVDLELETVRNKFVQKKDINAKAILECDPCEDGYKDFVALYGTKCVLNFDKFIGYAETQVGWITFLGENGFIERPKPKAIHKIGNVYTLNAGTEEYLLAQVNSGMVALINITYGNRYLTPISVDDVNNLSRSEFALIRGNTPFTFVRGRGD